MSWDLATAKLYLDSDDDETVQSAMDTTLAAIETMLARAVVSVESTLTVYPPFLATIILPNYPVQTVATIDGAAPADDVVINSREGWVQWRDFVNKTDPVEIVYTGGFDPIPRDLERCMYEALQYLWSATNPETGGPDGEVGTSPGEGTGDVSRITIQDFGSVTYDAASAPSGDGGRMAVESVLDWGWLQPWSATLQMYRSEVGVGLGVA